jgi:hypothetical protein
MAQSMDEAETDFCRFVGGLKVGASVMGLAVNAQANVVVSPNAKLSN